MKLLRSLAVCWMLALLASWGMACSEDEPYVRALAPVEEPSFDYGLYCDARGRLVEGDSTVLLVRRPSHLERVYADAQHGQPRAREVLRQLEESFVVSGQEVATSLAGQASSRWSQRGWDVDRVRRLLGGALRGAGEQGHSPRGFTQAPASAPLEGLSRAVTSGAWRKSRSPHRRSSMRTKP